MFFILSKTLNYLVMPVTVIVLCLLASALVRHARWKKRLFWTGAGMLLFFSNEFIANECMRAWEVEATPMASVRHHRLGIVLTGATLPLQPDDRVYFGRGADRVVHTVQLYKSGLLEKILISGGTGRLVEQGEPEADQFRRAMLLMGIPPEAITIENQTRNTYESAIEVKKLLANTGYTDSDCLLITSAFHMRRSLACYHKAGLNPEAFSTDFYTHERDFYFDTLFIPQLDALVLWHKLAREWMGMVAYWGAGYI
jgi:uncharacterized SAM-binding protein YcdF (DUF218 family)